MGNQCGKGGLSAITARSETEDHVVSHVLQLRAAQANLAKANAFVAQAKVREKEILSDQKVIVSALQSKRSELEQLKEEFAQFRASTASFQVAQTTLEADRTRLTEMEAQFSIDHELAGMETSPSIEAEAQLSIDRELAWMETPPSIEAQLSIDRELPGMAIQIDRPSESPPQDTDSCEVAALEPEVYAPKQQLPPNADAASDMRKNQGMKLSSAEIEALVRQDTAQRLLLLLQYEPRYIDNIMDQIEALEVAESTLQEKASKASGKLDASPQVSRPRRHTTNARPVPKPSPKPADNRLSIQYMKVSRKKLTPQPASGSSKPDSSEPKTAPPTKPGPSKEALSRIDKQSAEVNRKMSRIQVNLENVYGRVSCDNPRSHPKVKKLNKRLAKLRNRLRAISKMRYDMRRQEIAP